MQISQGKERSRYVLRRNYRCFFEGVRSIIEWRGYVPLAELFNTPIFQRRRRVLFGVPGMVLFSWVKVPNGP